jgi:paraquat-inducible protein A
MSSADAMLTSRDANLVSCHDCGHLASVSEARSCARCNATLHARLPDSVNRTWALLITAMILYIPANLMPITLTSSLGKTQGDTIMQGVLYFLSHGEWPIALVIFSASILVPLSKMIAMTYLLISVQRRSPKRRVERTKIYRMVEFVGRWSMIDVFVVTIMVALVKLGALATIRAGSGAIFFCSVVIITMIAAESFDPRLIWDESEADD